MIIKAKHDQSIFDLAVINTGDALKAFEMSFKNGFSVTDEIIDKEISYAINEIDADNPVLEVFNTKTYQPATLPAIFDGIFDKSFDITFE